MLPLYRAAARKLHLAPRKLHFSVQKTTAVQLESLSRRAGNIAGGKGH